MLKNVTVLLYTNFYNISLNVLRPTFFNIYNLPFLRSPNIGKIRVKVGPKTNYFSYILSSGTNRIAVFNNFFSLICSQRRDKQNRARDFLLAGSEFGNKNSFAKKNELREENNPPQAKKCFGFCEGNL